jgi:peptidoglycan hydrolase CwlO-like protein
MKFLPLLLLLIACSEQDISQIDSLKGKLKFLKQQRDSLTKVEVAEKAKIFEREIDLSTEQLVSDTGYSALQKNLTRLKNEIVTLDREIESTEEAIYKPQ